MACRRAPFQVPVRTEMAFVNNVVLGGNIQSFAGPCFGLILANSNGALITRL